MKLNVFAVLLAGALLLIVPGNLSAPAQTPVSDSAAAPALLSQADLEQVVAPVALYPDPMLALILQASTVPTDIVLARRWLDDGNSADDIDAQPWDDSVKGLARYPDVLDMMDDNLDWTNQLGAAVLAQQADVMRAVQAMRAKAQAQGNLETTAQQQVVAQNNVIQIVPANPQVIYVPVYDPAVIYYQPAPPIVFGSGFAIGIWLGGGCNWTSYNFYRGGFYRPGYGWGYRPGNGVIWRPPHGRPPPRPPYRPGRPGGQLPGWRPPPNWGKPHPPGGRPPGNRPPNGSRPPGGGRPPGNDRPPGGTRPGTRPGAGNPSIQPHPAPGNPNPSRPGNRPGAGGPSTQPVNPPGGQNPNRPGTRPAPQPGTRPNRPQNPQRPVTTQPAPEKPQVKPAPSRPSTQQPRPSTRPAPGHEFDRTQPSSKPQTRPAATRPAPQQHPAAQRPAPSRPAPQQRPAARPAQGAGGGNRSQ